MSYPHPKRNFVPKAVLMKTGMRPVNAAKPKAAYNVVKRNRFKVVKASACWVWIPKNRVVDHVSKNISALITLKRLDYIDAQGSFKWMHKLRGGMSMIKNLMQKLLLLVQKLMILLLKLKCTSEGVHQRQKIKKKGREFPEQKVRFHIAFGETLQQSFSHYYLVITKAVTSEMLKADHRRSAEMRELRTADRTRQQQLIQTLTVMQSLQGHVTTLQGQVTALQGQVTALQGQQGPVGGPTQPELPEEAGSSS
ncbi:hypothetical protein Tco_0502969 [Tanacetum coccineum]